MKSFIQPIQRKAERKEFRHFVGLAGDHRQRQWMLNQSQIFERIFCDISNFSNENNKQSRFRLAFRLSLNSANSKTNSKSGIECRIGALATHTRVEMEGDGTWKAALLRTRAHRARLENFKRIEANGMHMRAFVEAGIGVRTHGRRATTATRKGQASTRIPQSFDSHERDGARGRVYGCVRSRLGDCSRGISRSRTHCTFVFRTVNLKRARPY